MENHNEELQIAEQNRMRLQLEIEQSRIELHNLLNRLR